MPLANLPTQSVLTPPELPALLRVSLPTIYIWLKEGKLPAVKIKGSWRVSRAALDEFMRGKLPRIEAREEDFAEPMGLNPDLTRRLTEAVKADMVLSDRNLGVTSYNLKHFYETDLGTYVSNDLMKGVMLAAGMQLAQGCSAGELNWEFGAGWRDKRYNTASRYYAWHKLSRDFKPRTASELPRDPIGFRDWLKLCVPTANEDLRKIADHIAGLEKEPRTWLQHEKILNHCHVSDSTRIEFKDVWAAYVRFREVCRLRIWTRGGKEAA